MSNKDLEFDSNKSTPKWLKTIQLNSWEAELLISALVLYTLFQVPDYLNQYSHSTFQRGSEFIRVFNILEKGIKLLQIGYILHISVRGIWVASVGFSYVFPKGINQENLKFKGKFKKELDKKSSLVKNVLRLEELSSMIYGLSFTLFGSFIGFGSLMIFYVFIMHFFSPYSPSAITDNPTFFGFFTMIYLICILVVFIDFITSGLFRRKEWAVDWFYPIAWFFRIITLSFLYRRSLLVLVSNLNGWKARLVSLFIAIAIGGYMFFSGEIKDVVVRRYVNNSIDGEFMSNNYENLRADNDYIFATIQSDMVSDSYLKLFLKDVSAFNKMSESPFDKDEIKWNQQSSDSCSFYLNKWFKVKIDTLEYPKLNWVKSKHPKANAFGFHTYIDIQELEVGAHRLIMTPDTTVMNKTEKWAWNGSGNLKNLIVNILFYKQ